MKLLVIMARYPFPPQTGSAAVAYNNVKELAKRHSLYLICGETPKEPGDVAQLVDRVEIVGRRTFPRFLRLATGFFYMLVGVPTSVSIYASASMRKRVAKLVQEEDFHALLLYEISSIQFCPPSARVRAIVNIEDPPALRLIRLRDLSVWSWWMRLKLGLHARVTKSYERRFLGSMAKVLLLSDADLRDMQNCGGPTNLAQITYGVDQRNDSAIASYKDRVEGMIVLSGNMHHPANVDAVLFFLQQIFDAVLTEYPSATLYIVGAAPDRRIASAASRFGKGVVITGQVPEIAEYLGRARVSICPIRLKIGVQTKILEALALGTPVVTTSAGNSGVGGRPGTELWVEDDSQRFADRVVSLLRGEGWATMSRAGRTLVATRYSWARSAGQLEAYIGQLGGHI
jgi:glycosyltransferase involved in cell wall biosynthesis